MTAPPPRVVIYERVAPKKEAVPMDEQTALARIGAVQRAIADADVETIAKHIRLVDAAAKYAKAKQWSTTAWVASAWSMEARRAAGKFLIGLPKNRGAMGNPGGRGAPIVQYQNGTAQPPRLSAVLPGMGVTRREAFYWQALARIPDDRWSEFVGDVKTGEVEAHVATALRYVPHPKVATPPMPSGKYRCVVIDPPWPMERWQRIEWPVAKGKGRKLDYPTMSLDEIGNLDVPGLLDTDAGAQIYLWTTHRFLPDAIGLFEEWGVTYHCLLTWIKPEGFVPFSWMFSTEHVLFGYAGKLDVQRKGQRVHFEASRAPIHGENGHSTKPDVFYERVAAASYPKRLEMFARKPHDGFERWGVP